MKKNSLYIYWVCQTIYSNSYLKLRNTHLLHLFVDIFIFLHLIVFKKKQRDFARLICSVKNFQEMGTKSIFLRFQNRFSASYFPIS